MRQIGAKIIFVLIIIAGVAGCYFVFQYFMKTQGVEAKRARFSDYETEDQEQNKKVKKKKESKKAKVKDEKRNEAPKAPAAQTRETPPSGEEKKLSQDSTPQDAQEDSTGFAQKLNSFFDTSSLEMDRPQEDTITFETKGRPQEGVLSIDRENALFVVTMGRKDGIGPGRRLGVYSGDTKIATLIVESSSEVLSYAQPVGKSIHHFRRDQYRVIPE